MTALSSLFNADGSRRKRRKKARKASAGRRRNAKGHFLKGPVRKHRSADAALFAALGLDGAKRRKRKKHHALDSLLDGAGKKRKKRSDAGKKRKKSVEAGSGCTPAMKAAMNKLCQDMGKRAKEKAQAEANAKLQAAIEELRTAAGSYGGYKGHPGIPNQARRRKARR